MVSLEREVYIQRLCVYEKLWHLIRLYKSSMHSSVYSYILYLTKFPMLPVTLSWISQNQQNADYCKIQKNSDTQKFVVITLKFKQNGFTVE